LNEEVFGKKRFILDVLEDMDIVIKEKKNAIKQANLDEIVSNITFS
jgi:hypothetical protein